MPGYESPENKGCRIPFNEISIGHRSQLIYSLISVLSVNFSSAVIVESLSATLWAFLLTVTKVSRYVPYNLLVK